MVLVAVMHPVLIVERRTWLWPKLQSRSFSTVATPQFLRTSRFVSVYQAICLPTTSVKATETDFRNTGQAYQCRISKGAARPWRTGPCFLFAFWISGQLSKPAPQVWPFALSVSISSTTFDVHQAPQQMTSTMDKGTYKYLHGVIKMLHLLNVNIRYPEYNGFEHQYVAESIKDQSVQSFLCKSPRFPLVSEKQTNIHSKAYCLIQNPGNRCALYISPISRQGTTRITIATTAPKDPTLALATRIADHISHQTPASLFSPEPTFQISLLATLLPSINPQLNHIISELRKYKLSAIQSTVSSARENSSYTPDRCLTDAYYEERRLHEKRPADSELRRKARDWQCELSTAIERSLEQITDLLDLGLTTPSSKSLDQFYSVSSLAWMLSTSVIARCYIFSFFNGDDQSRKEGLERLFDALVRLGRYARGADKFKRYLKRSCRLMVPHIECVVVETPSTVLEVGELREVLRELRDRNADWECEEIVGETTQINFVDESIMVRDGGVSRQSSLREEWGKPTKSTMHPELSLVLKLREDGIDSGAFGTSQSRCGGGDLMLRGASWCLRPIGSCSWDVEEEIDGRVEMFMPSGIAKLDLYVLRRLERKLWDYVLDLILDQSDGRRVDSMPEAMTAPI